MTEIKKISIHDAVRGRPSIFFGNNERKRVINLIKGFIEACIDLNQTTQIFTVSIEGENSFAIKINSGKDLSIVVRNLIATDDNIDGLYLKLLKPVSKMLEISSGNLQYTFLDGHVERYDQLIGTSFSNEVLIKFELDNKVFSETDVDYQALCKELVFTPVLNRGAEVIVSDSRQKYLSQNYYHFPEGIFYLFDRIKDEVRGKPKFEIKFDVQYEKNKYQVAIAYRTDWFPVSYITSFVNNVHTIDGGSHVDGIIEGMALACKKYINNKNIANHKITRRKLHSQLILICSVRGGDFNFGGSFKETLESDEVKGQLKKLTLNAFYDYMITNEEKTVEFLKRFDKALFIL